MTKQPDAWFMSQIGETDHEKLHRLYDAVINEGGEDCLMSRMTTVENNMESMQGHVKAIVRIGWLIFGAFLSAAGAFIGDIASRHWK